eukprot:Gregarina_sp_Pseudo_9__2325@NODE_263_length_3360_cov_10_326408_g246_i0_p1_GENE_NODE_263_length_3360_cov_10_326408_g246_i0NODE_263_length_3360_cov_10_326408_g246_i0_p1_ORF_typecomplete_len512_score99_57Gly_kinase/PF02595_15/1_8e103_NODE_263_length_3360_cov_10_326408_g246_i017723307
MSEKQGYEHVTSEGGSLSRARFRFARRSRGVGEHGLTKGDTSSSSSSSRRHLSNASAHAETPVRMERASPQRGETHASPQHGESTRFVSSSSACGDTKLMHAASTAGEVGGWSRGFPSKGSKGVNASNLSVIVAMDSFKGSMSNREAAEVTERGLRLCGVESIYTQVLSDGGEGFLDAFSSGAGAEFERLLISNVHGAAFETLPPVPFLFHRQRKVAVIESAEIVGFTQRPHGLARPREYSSFGVGEVIMAALEMDAHEIYLGLGGTSVVDGGAGLAQALGAKYLDAQGTHVPHNCNPIFHTQALDLSQLDSRLSRVKFVVGVDVDNPLLGQDGAVRVFGPQKGVQSEEFADFEKHLESFSSLVEGACNKRCAQQPGSGAGGGLGFMCACLLGAEVKSGFDILAEATPLKERIGKADLVLTGEGCFDAQSLRGKLPVKVAHIAKATNTKVFLFAGRVMGDLFEFPDQGITCIVPLTDKQDAVPEPSAAQESLLQAVQRCITLVRAGKSITL